MLFLGQNRREHEFHRGIGHHFGECNLARNGGKETGAELHNDREDARNVTNESEKGMTSIESNIRLVDSSE
jgi:hypothetical protein